MTTTTTRTGTSASAVSAMLRRAGLRPVADTRREGIRVTRSPLAGHVHVGISVDGRSLRTRMYESVLEAARDAGYTVVSSSIDNEYAAVTVTR